MKCPTCSSKENLVEGTTTHTIDVGNWEFDLELESLECHQCHESLVSGSELAKAELSIARLLIQTGTKEVEVIRFLRTVLGMGRWDLAFKLEIPTDTVMGWENGLQEIPQEEYQKLITLVRAAADRILGPETADVVSSVFGRDPTKDIITEKDKEHFEGEPEKLQILVEGIEIED